MRIRLDRVLIAGAALWCAAIIAAPLFSIKPIYSLFSLICHQLPERSWFLFGHPLPVCIRCTAIYFGFLAALAARRAPHQTWLRVAVALTIIEVGFEWLVADSILARSLTGVLLGAATAPFVRLGVLQMLGVRQDAV